eukprot:6182388-Pleurochrysis_carterae.AAC.1
MPELANGKSSVPARAAEVAVPRKLRRGREQVRFVRLPVVDQAYHMKGHGILPLLVCSLRITCKAWASILVSVNVIYDARDDGRPPHTRRFPARIHVAVLRGLAHNQGVAARVPSCTSYRYCCDTSTSNRPTCSPFRVACGPSALTSCER